MYNIFQIIFKIHVLVNKHDFDFATSIIFIDKIQHTLKRMYTKNTIQTQKGINTHISGKT